MTIHHSIQALLHYATCQGLLDPADLDYAYNRILDLLQLDHQSIEPATYDCPNEPSVLLAPLLDYAAKEAIIPVDTVTQRDLFEAKLMDILMPRPSEVNRIFQSFSTPQEQTEYYYHLSQVSNYIKTARTSQNIVWKSETDYGTMDITINLSKPEKDPKDIILQGKSTGENKYPKCLLCKENVGYNGHQTGVGRTNHRIVPLTLNQELFYLQYSPYVYYNEHCIVLHDEHIPMNVTKATFIRLFDFLDLFPHYFLGSNAGLPIVGGSILSHEHYQGGRYRFAIEDATVLASIEQQEVTYELLHWPLSVIRLRGDNRESVIQSAYDLYQTWSTYHNDSLGIHAHTNGVPHNAITPIARKRGTAYELDMTLRNNRTSEAFPLGIFHPHPQHHHIKKENIGLIEVMGLAVLPARLKTELETIKSVLTNHQPIDPSIAHHTHWIDTLRSKWDGVDIESFIEREVTIKFTQVLEDAGVFKQTKEGLAAFHQFLLEVKHD